MPTMRGLQRMGQRLEPRKRLLVATAGCVLAAALVYLLLWEPAANGIRKLQADLPRLHEQDAAIDAMAAEVAGLRAAGGSATPIALADRAAAVRRSLERAGLSRAVPVEPIATQPSRTPPAGPSVTTVGPAAGAPRAPTADVVVDGERVRVRFEDIDYGVWAGWLAAAEAELAARAIRVSITSTAPKGPVGHVRAEALLDWTPAPSSASSSVPRP